MRNFIATFSVEKIQDGFIIRHKESGCALHAEYDFLVSRQVERLMKDALRAIQEDAEEQLAAPISGPTLQPDEGLPMVNDLAAVTTWGDFETCVTQNSGIA